MDIQEAFDTGFETVKNYVDRSLDGVAARLNDIDRLLAEERAIDTGNGEALLEIKARITALEQRQLERGEKGEPGRDGLGFDDLSVDYDGNRTVTFRLTRGETAKTFPFKMPVMIYRGAFAPMSYERGDTVTYGGSLWHCDANTAEPPLEGSSHWTRAVRRGRDGKNGKDGEKGEPGRAGRDLTQLAPDGSKW
jgi:hypothetical protein